MSLFLCSHGCKVVKLSYITFSHRTIGDQSACAVVPDTDKSNRAREYSDLKHDSLKCVVSLSVATVILIVTFVVNGLIFHKLIMH